MARAAGKTPNSAAGLEWALDGHIEREYHPDN